jgi:CTP synthase (UTP-ammonia lyase)
MSKKLEGNGRWESSRMMLPQHKEALIARQNPEPEVKQVQKPTEEEHEMILNSILLPMMLTMIERNGKEFEVSTNMLRRYYIAATQILMNRIHAEMVKNKNELKARKIRVFEDIRPDDDLHYKYLCRGYEYPFSVMRDVVKSRISIKLGEYVKTLLHQMRE